MENNNDRNYSPEGRNSHDQSQNNNPSLRNSENIQDGGIQNDSIQLGSSDSRNAGTRHSDDGADKGTENYGNTNSNNNYSDGSIAAGTNPDRYSEGNTEFDNNDCDAGFAQSEEDRNRGSRDMSDNYSGSDREDGYADDDTDTAGR